MELLNGAGTNFDNMLPSWRQVAFSAVEVSSTCKKKHICHYKKLFRLFVDINSLNIYLARRSFANYNNNKGTTISC